jgi:bacillolysin
MRRFALLLLLAARVRFADASGALEYVASPVDGSVSAIVNHGVDRAAASGATLGLPTTGMPANVAMYAGAFGISDPASELVALTTNRDELAMSHFRYAQQYHGLPVFGADLSAHQTADGQLSSIHGHTLRDIHIDPRPTLSAAAAIKRAVTEMNAGAPVGGSLFSAEGDAPQLMVYNQGFVEGSGSTPTRLVWQITLTAPNTIVTPKFMIDAHSGEVANFDSGVEGLTRSVSDCGDDDGSNTCRIDYYSAAYDYTFGRSEGMPARGPNPQHNAFSSTVDVFGSTDVDSLYTDLGAIQSYYVQQFARDGANARGGTGNGSSGDPYSAAAAQANINGSNVGVFCKPGTSGFVAGTQNTCLFCAFSASPDVFGHEYAHILAYYKNLTATGGSASNHLRTSGQAGAINEAHSDLFGEFFEHFLTGTNDWKTGTNALLSEYRSLSDPPSINNGPDALVAHSPDRFYSPYFYTGSFDGGGVHYNNGVLNKGGYLAAAGGQFNGWSVTGIGIPKLEQIMYRALTTYYSDSETFNMAYTSLRQATRDLYGEHSPELSQLTMALRAVELDQPGPASGLPLRHWGDFDQDNDFDMTDANAMVSAIINNSTTLSFDINGDDLVTRPDLDTWRNLAGYFTLGQGHTYLPSDGNLDGAVDIADYLLWHVNFDSMAALLSDANGNSTVDAADYIVWRETYNHPSLRAVGTVVPEPSAYILLACVAGLLTALRMRRKAKGEKNWVPLARPVLFWPRPCCG